MGTFHEDAVDARVEQMLLTEPLAGAVLADTRKRMHEGFWSQWYVDFFVQHHRSGYTLEDAFVFGQMHAAVCLGQLALVRIRVGTTPAADAQLQINQQRLAKLPHPFEAVVHCAHGGGADDDGGLFWSTDIRLERFFRNEDRVEVFGVPENGAPLEIGTTKSSRSFLHLALRGALARWAYGSEDIWLAHVTDTWRFSLEKMFERERF
mgnify:CR=1 FL=1